MISDLIKKTGQFFASSTLVLAIGAGALVVPQFVVETGHAAEEEEDKKIYADRKTRKIPPIPLKLTKALAKANEFMEAEDFASASEELAPWRAKEQDLNGYSRGQLYFMTGLIYYNQENVARAIQSFETVLRQEGLTTNLEDQVTYTLAQLHFSEENFAKSIEYVNKWLKYNPPNTSALLLLGQAYYSLGDASNNLDNFRKAIPYVEQAIQLNAEKGKEIRENWYLLLRAMYYRLDNYVKVNEILQILATNWPYKKEYWVQLAGVSSELGSRPGVSKTQKRQYELDQMNYFEIAHRQGLFDKNNELSSMAQLFLYNDIPYKASKTLKNGLDKKQVEAKQDNWELLSQAYVAGQDFDKSVEPLRKAAEMAEKGDLYMRLGQVYMRLDDYKNATKYIGLAIKKGGLKRPDNAHFIRGIAYFNLEDMNNAKKEFNIAAKSKRMKSTVRKWLTFVDREKKRLAERKEFLGR